MKRCLSLLIALLCALLLSSCLAPEGETPPEGSRALYFAAADTHDGESAVACEYRVLPSDDVPGLITALLSGPTEEGLVSPFPRGTYLRYWRTEPEGGVLLDFNETYGSLTGADLTLADYCLVLTLCQRSDVEYVHITVEGSDLSYWMAERLRAGDVLLTYADLGQ